MDTSFSVLGGRDRSLVEPLNTGRSAEAVEGIRSRGETPATTMAVDLAVVHAHDQRRSPDLKPKMEASPSAAVEGVDGAILA